VPRRPARELAERFYLFCVAEKDFLRQLNQKELSGGVHEGHVNSGESVWVCLLMCEAGLTVSNGQARRLDKQGVLSLTVRELIMQMWK
jgi:hypothetical protein